VLVEAAVEVAAIIIPPAVMVVMVLLLLLAHMSPLLAVVEVFGIISLLDLLKEAHMEESLLLPRMIPIVEVEQEVGCLDVQF
jgi:hypothetical protein